MRHQRAYLGYYSHGIYNIGHRIDQPPAPLTIISVITFPASASVRPGHFYNSCFTKNNCRAALHCGFREPEPDSEVAFLRTAVRSAAVGLPIPVAPSPPRHRRALEMRSLKISTDNNTPIINTAIYRRRN